MSIEILYIPTEDRAIWYFGILTSTWGWEEVPTQCGFVGDYFVHIENCDCDWSL